jgi:hypothetical protein
MRAGGGSDLGQRRATRRRQPPGASVAASGRNLGGAFFLQNERAEHSRTRTLGPFWNVCLSLSTLLLLLRSRSRWCRWCFLGCLLRRRSRRGRSRCCRSLLRGRSSRRCRGCRLLLLCLLLATHHREHEGHHEAKNKRCYLPHSPHLLSFHFYPERVRLPFPPEELQVGRPM